MARSRDQARHPRTGARTIRVRPRPLAAPLTELERTHDLFRKVEGKRLTYRAVVAFDLDAWFARC